MKIILILLIIPFLCIQCTNECLNDNIKLGDIAFNETTNEYFESLQSNEQVSFETNLGESRTHQIELQEKENTSFCVKVICRPSYEIDGLNGCEYYDTDNAYFLLSSNDSVDIHIKVGMELIEPESDAYYEYINVGISTPDTIIYAGYITASNAFDPSLINQSVLDNYMVPTNISEHTEYNRVLVFENEDLLIVYKKDIGLIKYKINNKEWTLVE